MEEGTDLTIRLAPRAARPEGGLANRAPFRRRRRDRHGRGLRGPLLPPGLPGALSRGELFEQHVMDSAERLHQLWGPVIDSMEFRVEEIPENLEELFALGAAPPLGSHRRQTASRPATIVIYRHPVQTAARIAERVPELVHDAVVEQAADLLGLSPETVDPSYGHFS